MKESTFEVSEIDKSFQPLPSELFKTYETLLEELASLSEDAGYQTRVFSPGEPSKFSSFEISKQQTIIDNLKQTNQVYLSGVENGVNSGDDRKMAWWAMRHLGLRPHSEAFSKIDERDVIEIYDANHKQIFRTFNFFPCLSYSLDEIHTYEWWELYLRDEAVNAPMYATVMEVLTTQPPVTVLKPFPTHWVQERFSENRNDAKIESRLLSPLMSVQSGQIAGYLNVFRVLDLKKTGVAAGYEA